MKKSKLPTVPTISCTGFDELMTLWYGPPGVGKTYFVNGLGERVFFLSTDRGSRNLKAMRREVFSWKKSLAVLDELEEPDAPHYDIVCIDHITDWSMQAENYCLEELDVESLTDRKLPFGKGWAMLKKQIRGYLNRIMRLGTGVAFIAHEKIQTVKTRGLELDYKLPSMGKTTWDLLIPTIDIIGYCHMRSVKTAKGGRKDVRALVTQPTETVYAKDRSLRITEGEKWEPLDAKGFLATFLGAYSNGKEETRPRGRRARGN